MKESIWKERVREDASAKDLEPCNRIEGRLCATEREGVLIVKGGKKESTSICGRSVEKGIYLIF